MPLSRLIILIIAAHPVSRTLGKSVESLMNVFGKTYSISILCHHNTEKISIVLRFACAALNLAILTTCPGGNTQTKPFIYDVKQRYKSARFAQTGN
jgi:hypothetical protein